MAGLAILKRTYDLSDEVLDLRRSYARVGKFAPDQASTHTHAKQFKRARRALKTLRTYIGRVMRDTGRKIVGDAALEERFSKLLLLARRIREQRQSQRGPKVYSLHAPDVECIGKGKAHRPYELMAWTTPAPSGNVESGGAAAGAQAMSNTN
ncbi:hypothetical protein IVB56_00155, partial [Bradyrhizobium sp. CW7]|nr:hypothetical protein [Bradyrhizobium sp. CW7]